MANAKRAEATSRRSEEKERRRAVILEAGVRLIAERGLDKVSFGDLAQATGLSRPLIYFYFADKEALYREAACEAHRRMYALFVQAARAHQSGLEQVTAMGRNYLDYYGREPHWFFLCADYESQPESVSRMDDLGEQIIQNKRGIMLVIEGALEKGIRDGSVRSDLGDLKLVALNLWAFSLGLIQTAGARRREVEAVSSVPSEVMMDHGLAMMRYMLAAKP